MTDTAAARLEALAARDEELRSSIAPVSADHVGELTMVEMQVRLIAAAEGNSLRDAIIRTQSARIAELTDEIARLEAELQAAPPGVREAIKEAVDHYPAPIRRTVYAGARAARLVRRAVRRAVR